MSWVNRVLACCLLSVSFAELPAQAQNAFINFETSQVHPIDLSPDRNTLAVCNTADARVELFDVSTGTPAPIGSVPVGVDPVTVRFRSDAEAWVVNHISDSISIVDILTKHVAQTVATKDEPCDVVFAGTPELAFVSCSQVNTIQRFDPDDLAAAPTNIPIEAEDPRALAVSPDKTKVYAAIFESGNGSTIIAGGAAGIGTLGFPRNDALDDPTNPYGGVNPPPNDPNDTKLPDGQIWFPPKDIGNGAPPRVGLIVKKDPAGVWRDDNGANWSPWITGANATLSGRYTGWDVVDRDVAILSNLNAPAPSVAYAERLMNLCMAIGVNPASGEITVVGTDATNEIRFEPVIGGRFLRVDIGIVDASNPANTSV
ncbi:MAG: YncE family protein, partial [Candidatus Hydrogenedentales bacterium]